MALSLNAEQKPILKILKIEDQYIIPSYQRPYSWQYEQCLQLYNDMMENFKPINEQNNILPSKDYFLGNIIIAKNEENRDLLDVIDGQQRLTTLLLIIKVFSLLRDDLTILKEILVKKDWTGKIKGFRIESEVFETDDNESLKKVLELDKSQINILYNKCLSKNGIDEKKCSNNFETNILYFYHWLKDYKELNSFIEYFLQKLFLLPIELTDKTREEAKEKALTIFETINNRGMNLEDADIFKAKLHDKAQKIGEEKIFIDLWKQLKENCDLLDIDIDDVFRFYTHIIRGQRGISTSEINLRKFFIDMPYSPFKTKKYNEIMDDLFEIVESLHHYETLKAQNKWIQLIDIYTNQYPKIAVIVYLFYKKSYIELEFNEFLKSLVRYIYYKGSTTKIKFEIYNIIKIISKGLQIDNYFQEKVTKEYFDYLGGLKNGYALLAYYLKNDILISFSIDKIITSKDEKYLVESLRWDKEKIELANNMLGNFVVLDLPKKNISYLEKKQYFKNSKIDEIRHLADIDFTYEIFEQRDNELKKRIVDFIKGRS